MLSFLVATLAFVGSVSPDAATQLDTGTAIADSVIPLSLAGGAPAVVRAYGSDGGAMISAHGRGFRARFSANAARFTPARGVSAPNTTPLDIRFSGARRAGRVVCGTSRLDVPVEKNGVVDYARQEGWIERYVLQRDGIEQRILVPSWPAGSGDLTVSFEVESSLQPAFAESADSTPEAGLLYTDGGSGGVRIGAVTIVDADGARYPGRITSNDNGYDLVVPGEVVDYATYPLLIDPSIQNVFGIPGGSANDSARPDVAWDESNDLFLVVWEERFSFADIDILAQRVASDGSLVSGAIAVETSVPTIGSRASVANVRRHGRFLITWQQRPVGGDEDIWVRAVDADTGSTSTSVAITSTASSDETDPDVGGSANVTDEHALVVYDNELTGIVGQTVFLFATGAPFLYVQQAIGFNPDLDSPSISKSGGEHGDYLVVWEHWYDSPFPGDSDLEAVSIDMTLVAQSPITVLAGVVGANESDPDVDGDGTDFYVAWAWDPTPADGSFFRDVEGLQVHWDGAALTSTNRQFIADLPTHDERQPAVSIAGPKALIAWSETVTGGGDAITIRGVCPETGEFCEPERNYWTGEFDVNMQMASHQSGAFDTDSDDLLIVWETYIPSNPSSDINALRYQAIGLGGSVVDQGGGCGGSGVLAVNGPVAVANADLTFELTGVDPAATLGFLNLYTGDPILFGCGPCTLQLGIGSTFVGVPSSGTLSFSTPVPADSAVYWITLECTALVNAPSSCGIIPKWSASNRLTAVIGY